MEDRTLTSLDWKSLVMAKNASVASVVPKCSPYELGQPSVYNKKIIYTTNIVNLCQSEIKISNLIEEVDYFGEDVETSPWVDGGLVENASLRIKQHHLKLCT